MLITRFFWMVMKQSLHICVQDNWVSMVLNPNGIEPTFLKLDSWSPGAGFIPIINSNVLN